MKTFEIKTGFFSQIPHEYHGENIFRAVDTKIVGEDMYYLLECGRWLRMIGQDQYITDWLTEERWGRVFEVCLNEMGTEVESREELGFTILKINRSNGLRLLTKETAMARWTSPESEPPRVFESKTPIKTDSFRSKPKRMAIIDSKRCLGCRMCIKACPAQAISLCDGIAKISSKCISCKKCLTYCPVHAISL